jgi:transcriptional regulator with XRE-family HTH domain
LQKQFSLGQRIRELRLQKKLTQIDLAKGLCTPSMVSQIESDRARPSYKMLIMLGERLDVPLNNLLVDVDMNLEAVSGYKMVRAMMKAGEYATAIPLYHDLLNMDRAKVATADILMDLSECYLYNEQLEQAEDTLKQVQELCILRQDHHMNAQVFSHLGKIASKQKKYQLSLFHYKKALEKIEEMEQQDTVLKAAILYSLGTIQMDTGLVSEAVQTFGCASPLYEAHDDIQALGRVYMQLGMSYKMLNDLSKSVEYTERAASIFTSVEHLLVNLKLKIETASMPMKQKNCC